MKNVILASVIVGALAGASSSMLTRALSSTSAGEAERTAISGALAPGEFDSVDVLTEQLLMLQRQNDELAMRLSAIEKNSVRSGREAVSDESTESYAQLQRDIADLAAALQNPQSAQAAGLRRSVRTAMDDIREEQEQERQQEREGREIARIDERLTDLQGKLGLDQVQMKSMREVLLTESTKRTELFQGMRNGGGTDRGNIRTAMSEMREETQASLGNILTPMQLEDYQKLESDNRFGGFGGGGGGRGGRDATRRRGGSSAQED